MNLDRTRAGLYATGFALLAISVTGAIMAFGATTPNTILLSHILVCSTAATFWLALWTAGEKPGPFTRRLLPLWIPILLLMGQGLFMIVNAISEHSMETWTFELLPRGISERLPGSLTRANSRYVLGHYAGGLALVWALAVLTRKPSRAWKVAGILGAAGILFAVAGIGQRALGFTSIYGLFEKNHGSFFGPYRAHSNAGTLILMTWPFCAALLLHALNRKPRPVRAVYGWSAGTLLLTLSLMVNVSRAAQIIGLITFSLFIFLNRKRIRALLTSRRDDPFGARLSRVLVAGVAVVAALILIHQSGTRWSQFMKTYWPPGESLRGMAYQVCWTMTREAGWFGFGAGTFPHLFPYYTHPFGDKLAGVWTEAHQDYLELTMEWGWAGAGLWTVLLFGGWAACRRGLKRHGGTTSSSETVLVYRAAWIAMLGFFLHALIDFPFQIYSLRLVLFVILGLAWSCALRQPEPDGKCPEPG